MINIVKNWENRILNKSTVVAVNENFNWNFTFNENYFTLKLNCTTCKTADVNMDAASHLHCTVRAASSVKRNYQPFFLFSSANEYYGKS